MGSHGRLLLKSTTDRVGAGIKEWGQEAVVRLPVEAGADREVLDYTLSTPLCRAADNGHYPAVRLLVMAGANKEASTIGGKTPLFLTTAKDHWRISSMLIEAGLIGKRSWASWECRCP
ncbi:ankyrin repeats (many copies) domain-containing protein [Hirsutella rhossiliensis]|uniref:Ankyrin repeats (Many copies) domain-containing protein n=1 Tax=Hirsutella rhossiliensis TaxID=111463 RepID=A0A9P8MRV0_9HYPO|nr:ankyrin repeats (many copies) domain-containing protein [Hirsutella rhossiliensis]KAH0958077.1 ankyrin repeats (many copies) domain-containing protein [Hirsutella rhossiliensis]